MRAFQPSQCQNRSVVKLPQAHAFLCGEEWQNPGSKCPLSRAADFPRYDRLWATADCPLLHPKVAITEGTPFTKKLRAYPLEESDAPKVAQTVSLNIRAELFK